MFCLYFVIFYLVLFRFLFIYISLIVMLFDYSTADILEAWGINNSDKDIKVEDISYLNITSFLLFFFSSLFYFVLFCSHFLLQFTLEQEREVLNDLVAAARESGNLQPFEIVRAVILESVPWTSGIVFSPPIFFHLFLFLLSCFFVLTFSIVR